MKRLEKVLKAAKKRDFLVVKAHAAGPKNVLVAFEAYGHDTEDAATCIVSVDLDTLGVELVHEAEGSSVDYVHAAGWHGLVQRDAVIEISGATPTTTNVALGADGRLTAIARTAGTTLVAGTKVVGNYAIDGFVAKLAKGKLAYLVESSKQGEAGPINALAVNAKGAIIAAGAAQTKAQPYRRQLFRGDTTKLVATPVQGNDEIYSVHQNAEGSIMIGCRNAAELYTRDRSQPLSGVSGRVHGVTEFRGFEYWMSHDGDDALTLFRRTGAKLGKKYRTKYHYVGYRHLSGAPEARMTATDDLLVVTNNDRIHLFDGKRWSQIAIQPDVKKLVKRLPTAMK